MLIEKLRLGRFRDNLLAQFSVVTFVIMVILALLTTFILIEVLNRNVELLKEHSEAVLAGKTIDPSDPISIPSLSNQVSNLKWIILGAIGGSFLYLYATLVYMVWEGWKTIGSQRSDLESANADLETRVAERVEDLREALEQGRRRLDAFQSAAGRLALEEVPERALQELVDVCRDLVGARLGVLALVDKTNTSGKLVASGLSAEQRSIVDNRPRSLEELGLAADADGKIGVGDLEQLARVHRLQEQGSTTWAVLGAQVVRDGRSAGALYLIRNEGEFTEDDQRLLNLFAVLAGVHIENVDLYEAVAQERRTLAAIQRSMTEGLVVLDPGGRVMYLNKTAQEFWGLDSEDASGEHIKDVLGARASYFESPEGLAEMLSIADAAGEPSAKVELTMAEPERRHLEVTAFRIPGAPEKHMTGLLARDVTQERELRERRNAFVSIASHELRTPMTSIMGFSELLVKDPDIPEATRLDWLERVHQNSQILSAIVDDMLDVSRIQSGVLALDLERVSLDGIIDEVLAGIRPETDRHEFVVEIPGDIPEVVADREKLAQVIINLATNAIKYSPEGGQVTISANHEEDRERVVVEVADQGVGIAPKDQEQLFSTFHRIRRPETEGVRGTGLGLSIVKGLAGLMGGDVWVKSELNEGSSFFFSIPTRSADISEGTFQASRLGGGSNAEEGATG